jgi:membrane associated rhomboid family serine protease
MMANMSNAKNKFGEIIYPAIGIVAAIWAVWLLDFIIPGQLNSVGIRPRSIEGLFGIATAPFLHGSWGHIISNTTPLFILSLIALAWSRGLALAAMFLICLGAGAGTWLFAQSGSNHIGASGLVYGLVGFLMVGGFFRKDPIAFIISIVVIVLYFGVALDAFLGIGDRPGVSWQGHLFGFISGVGAAWMFKEEEA